MFQSKNQLFQNLVFIAFFVVSVALLHYKSYDKLPTSIHAWAQSDHYALALGFYNDGFDFFHPTTFTLSHQFEPDKPLENPQGITAVDFPIMHYTVALAMKLLGTTAPWVFRLVMLLWSCIALWVLFKAVNETKGFWIALFVCGFIMFQPIYTYYQNGFHVSAAAFGAFLIGCSFMIRYFTKGKNNYFLLGIVFLTLAALMRFTQIISLIALFCLYAYNFIRQRKFDNKIIFVLVGILVVLAYFVYNSTLRADYGAVFLGGALTTTSIPTLLSQLLSIGISYFRGFIPLLHLFALSILIVAFIKYKIQTTTFDKWGLWLVFIALGAFLFTLLMSWSLSVHDYYSIDVWLPALTIGVIYLIYNIDWQQTPKSYSALLISMFLIGALGIATENQLKKYREDIPLDGPDLVIDDFKNSSEFLNNHIDNDESVLIICDYGWNTPMVGWQRKAFRVANQFSKNIPRFFIF